MHTKTQPKQWNLSDRFVDYAVMIIDLVQKLPNNDIGRHIAGQLLRAGTSTGANYEEGCGAESKNDFIHKMKVVLKELNESLFWLRVIIKANLMKSGKAEEALDETSQLNKIIGKSLVTAKKGKMLQREGK